MQEVVPKPYLSINTAGHNMKSIKFFDVFLAAHIFAPKADENRIETVWPYME